MSSSSNPTSTNGGAAHAVAEHILVMHCLREDSLLGQEGCTVRASSTGDSSLQQWALAVDHYELPFDLRSGSLLSTQTPRRLALMPAPGGRTGLVHSSYLKEDTRGRPHSFMSHLLIYPRIDTATAAESWGADEWPTEEYARGATKSLPPFDGVPRGQLVGEEALQRVLAREGTASSDQSLARVTYPSRVEPDPEARRRWLRAAINAYLKSIEPGAARNRVCVLAEPGTVALLVYALGRLLPPRIAGSFPFSTYEPPHTSFRENKVYRVLGSYSRGGMDANEVESLRRRGYVLDTFRPVPAAELASVGPWPLEPILDAVASGDWATVDGTREIWAADPQIVPGVTPATLGVALRLRPLAAALADGTISPEGLAELKSTPTGEAMLRRPDLRARAWSVLRPIWSRPGVAEAFTGLLAERVDELLEATRRKAEAGPLNVWRDDWTALKVLLPPARRADAFTLLLQSAGAATAAGPVSAEERLGVLRDWSETAGHAARLPDGLRWLLAASDASALRALIAGPPKPGPRHAGLALCLALSGANAGWQADAGVLAEATDEPFAGFLTELDTFADRKGVLRRLAPEDQPPATWLASRLLKLPARDVSAIAMETLLAAVRADDPAWSPFWLDGKNLVTLLERLGPGSKLASKTWAGLMSRSESEHFDAPERSAELSRLLVARKAFPASLTTEDRMKLDARAVLNQLVNNPGEDTSSPDRLVDCCVAAGTTREELADRVFRREVAPATDPREGKARAKAFGKMLLRLYGTPDAALPVALKAADAIASDGRRGQIKDELFKTIVPESERDRLYARNTYALSEISYVPSAAKPIVTAAPKRSSRTKSQSSRRGWFIIAGIGSALSVTVLGLFWFLGVIDLGPFPYFAKTKPQAVAKTNPSPHKAPESPASQSVTEENAALKKKITSLEAQLKVKNDELDELRKEELTKIAIFEAQLKKKNGELDELRKKAASQKVQSGSGSVSPTSPVSKVEALKKTMSVDGEAAFVDVPTDIKTKETAKDRFDFAFVTDRRSHQSVLATLRFSGKEKFGHFTFYPFNFSENGKIPWTDQRLDKEKNISRETLATNLSQTMLIYADILPGNTEYTLKLKLKDKPEWDKEVKNLADSTAQLNTETSDRGLRAEPKTNPMFLAIDGDSFSTSKYASVVQNQVGSDQVVVISTERNINIKFDALGVPGLFKTPNARVKAIGFIPGNRCLVSYEKNSRLIVFDLNSNVDPAKPVYQILNHDGEVLGWDVDASGAVLVSLDASDTLTFWEITKDGSMARFGLSALLTFRDITKDGLKEIQKIKDSVKGASCLSHQRKSVSCDSVLATGHNGGNVTLWQYTYKKETNAANKITLQSLRTLNFDNHPILKVAFSADGRVIGALAELGKKPANPPALGSIRLWPCVGLLPAQ